MNEIAQIKIHPAIGVARLGNHQTATFDGPQRLFDSTPPLGGYKKDDKIKRQAAVFRLFGYDSNGKLVKEITSADADIEWSVDLANKKASYFQFAGPDQKKLRNNKPPHKAPADKRHKLNIHPTPRRVNTSDRNAKFDDGKFSAWTNGTPKTATGIVLGELKMAPDGVLRVLAGPGKSRSPHTTDLVHYANNPGWCDDVADGPVNATLTLFDSMKTFEAVGAWVVCAPPTFAPPIRNIITMYDTLLNAAVQRGAITVPDKPSFAFDVYPLLRASADVKWLHKIQGHFFGDSLTANMPLSARQDIVKRLRNPTGTSSGGMTMPKLLGDTGKADTQTLTKLQYDTLKKWAAGNVKTGGIHGQIPPPPSEITPDSMDRASLEACVGAAFFPGIEAGWLLRDKYEYFADDPFRLNPQQSDPQSPLLKAGDITKQMACPWQADFTQCRKERSQAWWPAIRPDHVLFAGNSVPQLWAGTIDDGSLELKEQMATMVAKWQTLGFVVQDGDRYAVK